MIIIKIGIPQGLLYEEYHCFFKTFCEEMGAEVIESPNTNKKIIMDGVSKGTSEACLPIKVFHGHVLAIKDECDLLIIPRIMKVETNEFVCPKYCGLPEVIKSTIDDLPEIISFPLYFNSKKALLNWAIETGKVISNIYGIKFSYIKSITIRAFNKAYLDWKNYQNNIIQRGYSHNVLLLGHPCNLYDRYVNMQIIDKLNKLDVGVFTHRYVSKKEKSRFVNKLNRKPFWIFEKDAYGSAMYYDYLKDGDGIIYISSFNCGIDSVVIEKIKDDIKNLPLLVLKIDEQTGEAGVETRIEAFLDMIERKKAN